MRKFEELSDEDRAFIREHARGAWWHASALAVFFGAAMVYCGLMGLHVAAFVILVVFITAAATALTASFEYADLAPRGE